MVQKIINLYSFNELSEEVKKLAIGKWYKNEDYSFLESDLKENLNQLLDLKNIEHETNILYSLSYSQGDGLCITGYLQDENGNKLKAKHVGRYYHSKSTELTYYNSDGEECEEIQSLKDIYFDTCKQLEKDGYSILEHRMNNEEFNEMCEANEYTFTEDGKLENI